jgi:hypothetical protein
VNTQGLKISRQLERLVILGLEQTWNFFITKNLNIKYEYFTQIQKTLIIPQALDERTNLMDSFVITVSQDKLG